MPSISRILSKFAENIRGVATVEFAIIGPVLVALLIFSVNGFDAYRGLRRASVAVDTVSDLVSRKQVMNDTGRDALFATTEALLDRYANGATVSVVISSVEQDEDDNFVAVWSVANDNGTAHGEFLPAELANELPAIPDGESIILTELDFSFRPTFQDLWVGAVNVDQFSIARPRLLAKIAYE